MLTTVVNLKHEEYDVYVGRAGHGQDGYFGNPYPLDVDTATMRLAVIQAYKRYFLDRMDSDQEFKSRVLGLKGRRLGCFCKPKRCHADVIAEYLNNLPEFVQR